MMNKNKQAGVASITPTLYQGQQGAYTPPGRTKNGTTSGDVRPEELKTKLPIISPEFTLDYSDRMQKYVVNMKADEGTGDTTVSQEAYGKWKEQNPSFVPLLPPENVIMAQQSVEELNKALDYAEKNKLSPEQEFKKNNDTLLSIVNTLFAPLVIPSVTVTIPSPTPKVSVSPSPDPIPPVPVAPTSAPPISGKLLPNPLPAISSKAISFKQSIAPCVANRSVYEEASSKTGVSWEILAAIHYNEGSCGSNNSLVSGRKIGENEPDIVRGGGCSSGSSGPGIPFPLPGGGCGFKTLLDTAIFAGNHFKGKIGKAPSNFEELAKAFSRYNGGGNSNCGKTPYTSCPRLFEGEDDPYVVSMFDTKHESMYLVYCADLTKCNPPRTYGRPGAATIIRLVTNQL